MVVFEAGRPDPSGYRRFKVRLDAGESNDVAMMREVLSRRFLREGREGARFARRPDLLLVDGGKPQLSAARAVLAELDLEDVPVAALAKREEELFVPGWDEPVMLPAGSPSLYLVKRVRDEAHRFAITFHRQSRSRRDLRSALDEIAGVGPRRRKALLTAFGSLAGVRRATREELIAVVGARCADQVLAHFTGQA